MKKLYDEVSFRVSQEITSTYSTSFSKGISLLSKSIQPYIYAIYSFVRLADEIVDSFTDFPQGELFDKLREDYALALKNKLSINPVLNAFQYVVLHYGLQDLTEKFLESMEMDLTQKEYSTRASYQNYIHGSAEVVGLMCLKVFVNNDTARFEILKPYAIKLGSAFQKINFLRDLQDDTERLGRSYFPSVNWNSFSEKDKHDILVEIKEEFDEALIGINMLPKNSKLGVYIAYNYYLSLWKKLSKKSSEEIMKKRIRIPDVFKVLILQKSTVKYWLGMV